MFQSKNSATLGQQNSVQELVVTGADVNLYKIDASQVCVIIGDSLVKVISCSATVGSTGVSTGQTQAAMVISDSAALTAGGDKMAIRLTGVSSLAATDSLVIRYVTKH
jgi:hypothetical protein